MTVEYDGSDFCGFQWQPQARTVAGVLQTALARLFSEPIPITGAGRTDSGVHATGQVISCSTRARFPFERLPRAARGVLPPDCSVTRAQVVEPGFSARFSALERTYVYAILNRASPSAIARRYATHVARPLEIEPMRRAAEHFIGERDFRSFATAAPRDPTVRCVRRFAVDPRGELIRIEVTADGFLRHMVRTMVGTLIEVGLGRRNAEEIAGILNAADRAAAGPTAPPQGLYLAGVRYYDGYDSFAEPPILGDGTRSA